MDDNIVVYAKSQPIETLQEHVDNLLHNLKILKDVYKEEIDSILPDNIRDIFWDMLYSACVLHDCGKLFTPFQNVIRKQLKEETLNTPFENNIPHSYLSPAFIPKELMQRYSGFEKAFVQAIFYHHERDSLCDDMLYGLIVRVIKEDLEPKIDIINNQLLNTKLKISLTSLNKKYYKYISSSSRLVWWDKKTEESEVELLVYILLKGLLVRIDHCASAHVDVEDKTKENLFSKTQRYILNTFKKLNELQELIKNNRHKNMILIASTGSGKTEAALMWAEGAKTFFILPMRAALNMMYSRIAKDIGIESVGLLHSTSLQYLLFEEEDHQDAFSIYQSSKYLGKQLLLTTMDQVFTFPFRFKGYEKILATLAYSRVIIDEIQGYSPVIAATILKGIEMLHKFGTRFLIMTATLPTIYKDYLKGKGIDFETVEYHSQIKRHRIKIVEKDIQADVSKIVELAKEKNVLVITNTIAKAVEVYDQIKKVIGKEIKAELLHSQFIQKHRREKEERIRSIQPKTTCDIWITTQVIEASIDVDFDFLFTELSTLDSLFQRMGRCFRKREYDKEEPNVFIYTGNVSGIGKVYDKDIHIISAEMLKDFDGKIISEDEKAKLVEELYSYKRIKDTKYYHKFREMLDLIESIFDGEFEKQEVHESLRNIFNVCAIPHVYKEEAKQLFEKYSAEKNAIERAKIFDSLSEYIVEVPYWRVEKFIERPRNFFNNIYILNLGYNSETGINYEEVILSEMI
ncbi:CRISPR-associated helicase/endonuclease Cas3 [Anaerocellum danielii]|uniref:CRISPR-associated helicase/endonuclease Cas3 n=1 Tax=Anaerocellum danielii TaxID=1387557 RepID=A0ABZ0U1I7_9FIRM|nr:CRISPR-associated helicase/endonuclease Cas3 [Caldicellulosiruptor danielii]WPX08957.1 CRISPR-associated helicase/endonuclease Cas3 [Caldicellulosiruptor danielii]